MGVRRGGYPYKVDGSVATGETIVHAQAVIAAEGGKADGFLVLLVKKIGDAAGERNAADDEITGGEIETGVSRIAIEARAGTDVPDEEAVKIAVPASPGDVSIDVEVETTICGIQPDIAGIHGPLQEMVTGVLNSVGRGGGSYQARIVIGIVAVEGKPARSEERRVGKECRVRWGQECW